jgi:phage FluMu protein Com
MIEFVGVRSEIKVECLRCRHVGRLMEAELARRGIKADAPIASFIKRLRCRKCGSQSVRATRAFQRKAG